MRWRVTWINVLIRSAESSLCRKELASKARPRGAIDVEGAREHYAAARPGVLRDVAYAADIQAFLGQVPAAKADVDATQFRGR